MEPFVQTILAIMAVKSSGYQLNEEEYLYFSSCLRVQTLLNNIRARHYELEWEKLNEGEETSE